MSAPDADVQTSDFMRQALDALDNGSTDNALIYATLASAAAQLAVREQLETIAGHMDTLTEHVAALHSYAGDAFNAWSNTGSL